MVNAPVFSMNGGEVGDEALARLDLERMQFCGSLYSNVLPRTVGSMTLRPGLEHVQNIDLGEVMLMDYPYAGDGNLVPVLSDYALRVAKDGSFISRDAVSTTIENGDFASFSGWSDESEGTASATVSSGSLMLKGTSQAASVARSVISVAPSDQNTVHGLRVKITRGPVSVSLGTTAGAHDLIEAVGLDDGDHSIPFTPGAETIYLDLETKEARTSIVESCTIDAEGSLVLDTPWSAADLSNGLLRYTKHKDVTYVASGVYQQREIHRRISDQGWGVQRYKIDDGPFYASGGEISLQPNVLVDNGSATLTADTSYFDADMVGRLFRIYHSGQTVEEDFSSAPSEGDYIRISGVDSDRSFTFTVSGTWAGTVRLQIATDDGSGAAPGSWSDVRVITSNSVGTHTDSDDNVIKYARFALETDDLTSGTVETILSYDNGSGYGVARVLSVESETVASVEILQRFTNNAASFDWDYSIWSDYDGWPSAVERFGGRLYWAQIDTLFGSVPDAYKSFDDGVEGDSAPIIRAVGSSSSRGVLWLLGLQRLIAGTDEAEYSIKSSSYDEPLTNDAWLPIPVSDRGCADIRAAKIDQTGFYIQSSGERLFSLDKIDGVDYKPSDLMELHEEICDGFEVVDIAVQRHPDTMLWVILSNGEARVMTYEPGERVVGWSRFVTDGAIKRVCATRGKGTDSIHFAVERGGVLRLEKLASVRDCRGGSKNLLADAFTHFEVSSPTTTFSVPQLDGMEVTVWVNGSAVHDQGNLYTVSNGEVVLSSAVDSGDVVIGLPYVGKYQSTKLAYGAKNGTALFQKKKISQLGLYLVKTAVGKLLVGKDFDTLRPMSDVSSTGRPLEDGEVLPTFDYDMQPISSDWNTDSRICIQMQTPYPATVAAMVLAVDTNG